MIDWDNYNYNQEVSIKVLNEGVVNELTLKLLDYGWHAHGRIKITAILEVIKSDDLNKWHIGAILELPIKTDGLIKFIQIEHNQNPPRLKTIRECEIIAFTNC